MNDQAILNYIFDPSNTFLANFSAFNPLIHQSETKTVQVDESVKEQERQAVQLAEKGLVQEAIVSFSNIINEQPDYASVYNNRAQAYRMIQQNELARIDLNNAIEKAGNDQFVLGQAYTQRAILNLEEGKHEEADGDFALGARCGNSFAKAKVRENPYAKLCSAMVNQMMSQYEK